MEIKIGDSILLENKKQLNLIAKKIKRQNLMEEELEKHINIFPCILNIYQDEFKKNTFNWQIVSYNKKIILKFLKEV